MTDKKFDPKKLQKLNNPERLLDIPPDYIWEKLQLDKAAVLVEIGAGTAFFSKALLKKSAAATVYACDLSEVMLEWMKDNIIQQYPAIVPVKSEESKVPLGDNIADLVFMINLHHELDNPALTLAEAYRMLRPDGKLLVVDWKKTEMAEGPPQEIRCVPEQVRQQCFAAGLTEVRIYEDLPKHFVVVGAKDRIPVDHGD